MKLQVASAGLALLLVAGTALAQPVYRQVDKNGKVTFTDQAPAANAPAVPGAAARDAGGPAGAAALPYALRQVVQRYPVTLYSGEPCGPCGAGRTLLVARGIPFEERSVKSGEDVAALQRLSGQSALPLLTIGAQQLNGFSQEEWLRYLDAAGYPASSQLPSSYRPTPAQPLVSLQPATSAAPAPAAGAAPAAPSAAAEPAAPAGGANPANPAGIRF
jgi:hypothetical protein